MLSSTWDVFQTGLLGPAGLAAAWPSLHRIGLLKRMAKVFKYIKIILNIFLKCLKKKGRRHDTWAYSRRTPLLRTPKTRRSHSENPPALCKGQRDKIIYPAPGFDSCWQGINFQYVTFGIRNANHSLPASCAWVGAASGRSSAPEKDISAPNPCVRQAGMPHTEWIQTHLWENTGGKSMSIRTKLFQLS